MAQAPDGGFLPRERLQQLFDVVREAGYRCLAPVVRDGAIAFAESTSAEDLPVGMVDDQAPGSYRLSSGYGNRCFAWANGPQALKPLLFPPRETLWNARRDGAKLSYSGAVRQPSPMAVIGVRACDIAAARLLERHFGAAEAPGFAARRSALLLVGVDCAEPAATCFCAATGDGPGLDAGGRADYDLGLTELDDGFLVRAASPAGRALQGELALEPPGAERLEQARRQVLEARNAQQRRLPRARALRHLYARLDHPRWEALGERCLGCGNCTAVCPTCFCSAHETERSLDGVEASCVRQWDSCFSDGHSLLHGHPLRAQRAQRYRQWLTHKLAGWQDQFGRPGCVGCGRCITWCPVGIDLTEEVPALLAESVE